MSNNVVIDQSNNTVTTDTTSTQNQVLLSADIPNTVEVLQNIGEIVTISAPGPQGAVGVPLDISGYLTTASFNQFTASYNTASFSGSFSGDGSELQNIPASGIIGLNLSQIATGSVTASVSSNSGSFEIVSGSSSFLFVSRSGVVGVGTTTPRAKMEINGDFRIGGSFYAISDGPKSFFVDRYSNNSFADEFGFRKARGTSANPTTVVSQDEMGGVEFYGYDGSTFIQAAKIYTNVDGPVSTNSVPGRISFYVNNGTGNVTNEIVRMTSLGLVGIGKTSPTVRLDVSGSALITGSLGISQDLTASNALFTGNITAQTLVVQTVTSSVVYSSGSNIFGNQLSNTQTFTGSVNVTGSLTVIGKVSASDITGSLFGTASWAENSVTASYALNAGAGSSVAGNLFNYYNFI